MNFLQGAALELVGDRITLGRVKVLAAERLNATKQEDEEDTFSPQIQVFIHPGGIQEGPDETIVSNAQAIVVTTVVKGPHDMDEASCVEAMYAHEREGDVDGATATRAAEHIGTERLGGLLEECAERGRAGPVRVLLLARANPGRLEGPHLYPAFVAAARYNRVEIARALLDARAEVERGPVRWERWGAPLVAASHAGHVEMVNLLLDERADVGRVSLNWGTPLGAASHAGHVEMVNLLLGRRADVDHSGRFTPLVMASRAGHVDIVHVLLGARAGVDRREGAGTALYHASFLGRMEIVTVLLGAGARVNEARLTPLAGASGAGHVDIVRALLDGRADVNSRAHFRGTALTAALEGEHAEIVDVLMAAGAEI